MLSSQGYAVAFRRRPAPLTGKASAMLAILASLAIAGAGVAAMASIVATLHSQWPAIRRLLADARTLDANSLEQGEWLDQVGAFDQVGALDHAATLDLDRLFLARMIAAQSPVLHQAPALQTVPACEKDALADVLSFADSRLFIEASARRAPARTVRRALARPPMPELSRPAARPAAA